MPIHPDDEISETLPKGWFVLYCPVLNCNTSITWTKEVHQSYDFEEWFTTLNWFISQCDHDELAHVLKTMRGTPNDD